MNASLMPTTRKPTPSRWPSRRALGRRIAKTVEGSPDVTTDTYYNTQWQVLEVHEGGDAANPLKQFVWDVRYIDAPVVRFHDGDTNGTIDDTLYYTT